MQLPYSNTQLRHWNPGASMPLVLPVHLVCNTSDEEIYSNIRANSRTVSKWLPSTPAHDGIAVLCGSGPSLADFIPQIKLWQEGGAKVYAMNGAAAFLYAHGVFPDYQVILDARVETADLIGPAGQHLFASQVHPECFRRAVSATLWHLQVEGIDDLLPPAPGPYCLVGGAASVGNTAACLAYAMGFRRLHLYGYDSCHRAGNGHAFHQKMNDGDPCASVRFGGVDYVASLTMKLQAEKFPETAAALKRLGCRIEVHGDGLLPAIYRAPTLGEREKYEAMWTHPEYRIISPGELILQTFIDRVKPAGTVVDFGCGTGRAGLELHRRGYDVTLVDFTPNSRDPAAALLPFVQADLTDDIPVRGEVGYCTDVLEHIPPADVERAARNIAACVPEAFFQVGLTPDTMGTLIGHDLHLSVYPYRWWLDLFGRLGSVAWSEDQGISAIFHVRF